MPVEKLKSLPKVNVFVRGQCKIVQSVFTFLHSNGFLGKLLFLGLLPLKVFRMIILLSLQQQICLDMISMSAFPTLELFDVPLKC